MGSGEAEKRCCLCGFILPKDADRCPRCGNVLHKQQTDV